MARTSSLGLVALLCAAFIVARTGLPGAADGTVTVPHNTTYWGQGTETTTTTTTPAANGGTTTVVKDTIRSTEKDGTTHEQVVTTTTVTDAAGNTVRVDSKMEYVSKAKDGTTRKTDSSATHRAYNPLGGSSATHTGHFVIYGSDGHKYVVDHRDTTEYDAANNIVGGDHHEISDVGTSKEKDLHQKWDQEHGQFREVDAAGNYISPAYPKYDPKAETKPAANDLPEPSTQTGPYTSPFGKGTVTQKSSTTKAGSNTTTHFETHTTVKNAAGETRDEVVNHDVTSDRDGNAISEKSGEHDVDKDAAGNPVKIHDVTSEKKYNEAGGSTQITTDTTTTVTKDGNHVDKETTTETRDAAGNVTGGERTKTTNSGESGEKTVKQRWNGTAYQNVDANGYFITTQAARPLFNPWVAGGALVAGGILVGNADRNNDTAASNSGSCSVGRICFTPSSLQFTAPNQTLNFAVSIPGNTGAFSLSLSCPSGGSGTPGSWSGSGSSGSFSLQSLTTSSGRPCTISGSAANGATGSLQLVF